MLACDCEWGDDPAWWHEGGGDVKPLNTKIMRRCRSCDARIAVGDDCKPFARWKTPEYGSIEERIYGEDSEVPLATWYFCDRCAGLYESLDGLGFCGLLGQDLREVCREYAQMQRDAGVFRGQMVVRSTTPTSAMSGAVRRPPRSTGYAAGAVARKT